MSKIGFNWGTIHQEILCEFCEDFKHLDENEFMKKIFPEKIFSDLFIQNDLYRADFVSAVYAGQPKAEPIYKMMAKKLRPTGENGRRQYTSPYDKNSTILAFQKQWEELLPFSKVTSGVPNKNEEEKRKKLNQCINDILFEIPAELTNINIPLNLLIDQQQYSMVLAILSVMATALSQFENNDSDIFIYVLPFIGKDPASFEKLCRSETKITWEMLHNLVLKRLINDGRLDKTENFLPALIPEKLLHILCATKEKDGIPSHVTQKNLGLVYRAKTGASSKFQAARNAIITQTTGTGEPCTWNTSPIISHFKEKWEELIPATQYTSPECEKAEDPNVKNMQAVVDCLLNTIPHDRQNVSGRLQAIICNQPYSMVLAILSVIASTLFCFAMEGEALSESDRILADVVLPPLPEKDASPVLQNARTMLDTADTSLADLMKVVNPILENPVERGEAYFLLYKKAVAEQAEAKKFLDMSSSTGYLPAIQINNKIVAMDLLDKARSIFMSRSCGIGSGHLDKSCCIKCETILRMPTDIPRECRAEASYMLYKCISLNSADRYQPVTGETAEYYLEISYLNGYKPAIAEWTSHNTSTIVPQINRSDCPTPGICYCNAVNKYTVSFEQTIPESWGGALTTLDGNDLSTAVCDPIPRRFLFLSDDFSKNLSDLFQTLQLIKDHEPNPETHQWEFFIRHDSESIHALVDTALSRLSEYQIPVYIINDNKVAAQQLLSHHPLFYPVRELMLDKIVQTDNRRPLLHFVVIGNSPVTEWLVREAFWMMGFRNNAIRCKITVLAENGEDFEVSLKGRFPGMRSDITKIEKIELPEIKGENVPLESAKFQEAIQKFTQETDYCYFAVATDSDEGNLTLATRVREATIRAAIETQQPERLTHMPPVAFLCRNEEIAWLSKCMVVEKEEHGNAWFNTRALIPFGEVSNRYHFDRITGGTFDLLAKCIHYQYSQLDPEAVLSGSANAVAAQKKYYLRQYNQDSSYSIALGMPYRLFQFPSAGGSQVVPIGWDILKSTSFASVDQLHFLSMLIKDLQDAEIQAIAEWEHARWVRWMLSRGWKAATVDEAVFAVISGNPRQQLFACKMHPCICSYEAQEVLTKRLHELKLKQDFFSYDYRNIMATRQLLDLEWVVKKTTSQER